MNRHDRPHRWMGSTINLPGASKTSTKHHDLTTSTDRFRFGIPSPGQSKLNS
jgi:hypothetical protein